MLSSIHLDENICSSTIVKVNIEPSLEIVFIIFIFKIENLSGENL